MARFDAQPFVRSVDNGILGPFRVPSAPGGGGRMRRMGRVVAVANQKGGVAKTTTVASLGAAFAEQGMRVLLVDLDAQACLTFSLGVDPDELELSVNDVVLGSAPATEVIMTVADGVDLLPSAIDLAGVEAHLLTRPGREFALRSALSEVVDDYQVVLLDCAPSLGVLTLAALTAAQEVIVPLQCEMLSHRGVGQLLDTIADVQRLLNSSLTVRGILPTMFDGRTTHARAVLADVSERYDLPVLEPPIPRSVRFAEAPAVGRSILVTAAGSTGAQAYRDVAASLARSWARPRRAAGRRRAATPASTPAGKAPSRTASPTPPAAPSGAPPGAPRAR